MDVPHAMLIQEAAAVLNPHGQAVSFYNPRWCEQFLLVVMKYSL